MSAITDIADDYNKLDNDKKCLITDSRIIISTDVDSYEEEDSYLISNLEWVAISSKKNKGILL